MDQRNKFWQEKSLFEMTHSEWESVCDGCGKCCLTQLQDEQSNQLVFTDVACELLDDDCCRCRDYENRSVRIPSCMTMTKDNISEAAQFAPSSCAYRLLLQDQPLPEWHHLVSGNALSVHQSGNSVRQRVRYERDVIGLDFEDFIVEWPSE